MSRNGSRTVLRGLGRSIAPWLPDFWQQVNTMPPISDGICTVYQIGNGYSQWFTTKQWIDMNIRFIELTEQEGLGRDMDELIHAIDDTICNQNQPDHPDRLDFAQHFRLTAKIGHAKKTEEKTPRQGIAKARRPP